MATDQRNAEVTLIRAGEIVVDELMRTGVLDERPAPPFMLDFGTSGAVIASQIAALVGDVG